MPPKHFEKEEKLKRQTTLEKSYLRAAKGKVSKDFDPSDIEGWPEWDSFQTSFGIKGGTFKL